MHLLGILEAARGLPGETAKYAPLDAFVPVYAVQVTVTGLDPSRQLTGVVVMRGFCLCVCVCLYVWVWVGGCVGCLLYTSPSPRD